MKITHALAISSIALSSLFTSTYADAGYRDSFISFEVKTNTIFSKKNIKKKVYPASMTKILTAYIILRDVKDLKKITKISKNAWGYKFRHGSRMFLEPNTEVTIEDLLKGLLIQSGNDSAIALAEFHSGSTKSFVKVMNKTAKAIGMMDSNFANPNGRHNKNHYTTASDFKLLIDKTLKETPEIIKFTTLKSFKYNGISQHNRNKMLDTANSIGLKTGYTPQSGYNLTSCFDENGGFFCTIEFGSNNPRRRFANSIKAKEKYFSDKKVYQIDPQIIYLNDKHNKYTINIPSKFTKLINLDESIETTVIRKMHSAQNENQNVDILIKSDKWEEKIKAVLLTTELPSGST